MTRILQIIPFPSVRPRDGGQIRAQQIGKELEAAGFTVIRCPIYRAAWQPNSIYQPPVVNLDELAYVPRYQHIWQLYDLTNGEVLANDPRCFAAFKEFVEQARPDVLMLEHPWLWPAVKKLPGRSPVIYNSYNLESELKRRILRDAGVTDTDATFAEIESLEQDLVNAAAAVSATTEADAAVYRDWTSGTVVVAPNGAEPRERAHLRGVLPDALKSWWRYLLFVASAHPPNGAGFAELVIGGLASVGRNERIVVVGSVCDLISRHIGNSSVASVGNDRLELLGHVPSFMLDCLIENAAGILLPITYGGGSNLKTVEALLAGRPIIATARAFRGCEEFAGMPGVLIAETAGAFSDAMRRVLSGDVPSPPKDERLVSIVWNQTLQPIVDLVGEVVLQNHSAACGQALSSREYPRGPVSAEISGKLPTGLPSRGDRGNLPNDGLLALLPPWSGWVPRTWSDPRNFECHAALLARLHSEYGIVPDYEHILECGYRRIVPAGATVIDVGAHAGRHTAIFSDLVGPDGMVLAFEPLPHLAMALRGRGFDHRVCIHECALGDFSGRSSFTYMRGTPGESGLRERISNYPQQADPVQIDVQVRQLDEFLAEIPSLCFVKLDIEGGEVACLRGAAKMLARFRPFISIEYGKPSYSAYGLTARSLYDTAQSLGYQIADLFGAICPSLPAWERACDLSYWDWFLVPCERAREWNEAHR